MRKHTGESVALLLVVLAAFLLCSVPTLGQHPQPTPRVNIEPLIEQARAEEERGEFLKAQQTARRALALAERQRDERAIIASLTRLGRACIRLKQLPDALSALQRALSAAQKKGDKSLLAPIHQAMGEMATVQGRLSEAMPAFQQALSLAQASGDQRQITAALISLGNIYTVQGETAKAMTSYQQALPLAREPQDQVAVLTYLGSAYLSQAGYARALEYFQRARRLAEPLGNPLRLNVALSGLAQIHLLRGELDEALNMYQQVLRSAEQLDQSGLLVSTLISMGILYTQRGEPAPAESALKRALKLAEGQSPLLASAASLYLGVAHFQQFQCELARREIQRALRFGIEGGISRIAAEAYSELGKVDEAEGAWPAALNHYREAIRHIETIRHGIGPREQRAEFFGSARAPYERLIGALLHLDRSQPNEGHLAEAVNVVERARARALLDQLAEAPINASAHLDPDLRRRETSISQQIAQVQSALQLPSLPPAQRAQLTVALHQAEQAYEQLTLEIRQRNPRYAQLRYPEPITADLIQQLLPPRTAMLEYFLGQDRAWLFAITRDQLRVYPLGINKEWLDGLENYLRLLADDNRTGSEMLVPIAQRLYDQ